MWSAFWKGVGIEQTTQREKERETVGALSCLFNCLLTFPWSSYKNRGKRTVENERRGKKGNKVGGENWDWQGEQQSWWKKLIGQIIGRQVHERQYGNLVCEMYYAFNIDGNIRYGSNGPDIRLSCNGKDIIKLFFHCQKREVYYMKMRN